MKRNKIATLFKHYTQLMDQTIQVAGWVKSIRKQKNISFVDINDGSHIHSLQVILDESATTDYVQVVDTIKVGCSLRVQGNLHESPGQKQPIELRGKSVEVIGTCPTEIYPLQKKYHSFEFLRTIAHLRPRTNTGGAVARIRSQLAFATHSFFHKRGFLYLPSPILTSIDCEGAGELFQVTTLNLQNIPRENNGSVQYSEDFFKIPTYLTVSGQLNAEAFALSLSDVYTFGPTFRAENSHTSRHLAEFWMIEPEMAFATLEDIQFLAEEYLKEMTKEILSHCKDDITFFEKHIDKEIQKRLHNVVETTFTVITYTEAVSLLEKAPQAFVFPVKWGMDLQSEHERYLAENYFHGPVCIINYPKDLKAFYMRDNDDGNTVSAMDIIVPKIGEIVGGSQREDRLDILTHKITKQGLSLQDYSWYLDLRRFGSAPHSGFGVGFERLIQFLTGIENIREVSAFPRSPGQIVF
ncbi:MAG: asparagine--tRNA ligase [Chlamydiales bacterium]